MGNCDVYITCSAFLWAGAFAWVIIKIFTLGGEDHDPRTNPPSCTDQGETLDPTQHGE